MNPNNEDIPILAVSYVVDGDQLAAEETPTPVEGVPIESATDQHPISTHVLDFKPEMLA